MIDKKLRILHTVESYLPSMHGMAEVVKQLSEYLVQKGHKVVVATSKDLKRETDFINGVQIVSFDIRGKSALGIDGEVERYEEFLLGSDFDVIVNFAAQQWATDICLNILSSIKSKKVFVPTGFSGLHDPQYHHYYEEMKTKMKLYDANVFLSYNYQDISFAHSHGMINTCVIPNGASDAEFSAQHFFSLREKLQIAEDQKIILHVGSYTGVKGHDEAADIFLAAGIDNAVLVFIGQNFGTNSSISFRARFNWFKEFGKKGFYRPWAIKALFKYIRLMGNRSRHKIHLISLNRNEVVAAYQQADLFLFPSLVECSPIVLFEAMASKTPFLVTDVGNAVEINEWSHAGMILPTVKDSKGHSHAQIKESAAILKNMLPDQNLLDQLANNGYKSWQTNFTWEIIANKYENLYFKLVNT